MYYRIRRTFIVHATGKPRLWNQWYQYKELWIIIVISSMPLSNKHVFRLLRKILPLKRTYRVIHFISFGVHVSRYHSEHRESGKTYACVSFIDWFMVISRNPHNGSRRCLSYPHHKAARWLNLQTKRIAFWQFEIPHRRAVKKSWGFSSGTQIIPSPQLKVHILVRIIISPIRRVLDFDFLTL